MVKGMFGVLASVIMLVSLGCQAQAGPFCRVLSNLKERVAERKEARRPSAGVAAGTPVVRAVAAPTVRSSGCTGAGCTIRR